MRANDPQVPVESPPHQLLMLPLLAYRHCGHRQPNNGLTD